MWKVELYRIRGYSIREYGSFAIFDSCKSTRILLQKDPLLKYPMTALYSMTALYPDTTLYPIPTWFLLYRPQWDQAKIDHKSEMTIFPK